MYSTCLFCHRHLGANDAIEQFTVGRRIAFDSAKGRLWVVCQNCNRWNLTPVEERWEAIEDCERRFRGTKLRASTDHIGLARLSEGLELVRIGDPQRPEFASWRYGDQFALRRRRAVIRNGVAAVGLVLLVPIVGLSILGTLAGEFISSLDPAAARQKRRRWPQRISRLVGPHGVEAVRNYEVETARLLAPTDSEPWGLQLTSRRGVALGKPWFHYDPRKQKTEIRGELALRAAMRLLPLLNRAGAPAKQVREAVAIVETDPDTARNFARAASLAVKSWDDPQQRGSITNLSTERLLALEMVAHEDTERRAVEGELMSLEGAWREAEEIAAISDNMFVPQRVTRWLTELKIRNAANSG